MTQRETRRTNGSFGRTERNKEEKWHGRGGNVGRKARDETGKRYGRERNVDRVARDERKTGKTREGDGKPQERRREDQC